MDALPEEVLCSNLFIYLSPKDIVSLSACSRLFSRVTSDDRLWFRFCQAYLPPDLMPYPTFTLPPSRSNYSIFPSLSSSSFWKNVFVQASMVDARWFRGDVVRSRVAVQSIREDKLMKRFYFNQPSGTLTRVRLSLVAGMEGIHWDWHEWSSSSSVFSLVKSGTLKVSQFWEPLRIFEEISREEEDILKALEDEEMEKNRFPYKILFYDSAASSLRVADLGSGEVNFSIPFSRGYRAEATEVKNMKVAIFLEQYNMHSIALVDLETKTAELLTRIPCQRSIYHRIRRRYVETKIQLSLTGLRWIGDEMVVGASITGGKLVVWDLEKERERKNNTKEGELELLEWGRSAFTMKNGSSGSITCMAVYKSYVAVGSQAGKVQVFDVSREKDEEGEGNKEKASQGWEHLTFMGHKGNRCGKINDIFVDGKEVISASQDTTLRSFLLIPTTNTEKRKRRELSNNGERDDADRVFSGHVFGVMEVFARREVVMSRDAGWCLIVWKRENAEKLYCLQLGAYPVANRFLWMEEGGGKMVVDEDHTVEVLDFRATVGHQNEEEENKAEGEEPTRGTKRPREKNQVGEEEEKEGKSKILRGYVFCITGRSTLSLAKTQLKRLIEHHGGTVVRAVDRATHLLCNQSFSNSRLALQKNVPQVSEEFLFNLIGLHKEEGGGKEKEQEEEEEEEEVEEPKRKKRKT